MERLTVEILTSEIFLSIQRTGHSCLYTILDMEGNEKSTQENIAEVDRLVNQIITLVSRKCEE